MKWMPIILLLLTEIAAAKVEVLFHPHDPTLEKIASWISEAESSVDVAMYNLETSDKSPVIQALKSEKTQERLKVGSLRIRLLFEGYATPEENEAKMAELEALGVDVRYLGMSVKVHHKFAVLDAGLKTHRVVTGSANWSLSSYRNYNENIVFFTAESEITGRYHTEFLRLWENAKPFGFETQQNEIPVRFANQKDFKVHFNSPKALKMDGEESNLTNQVVRLIDSSQHSLKIATTRVRLQPILEALANAAERGVQIQLIISQDDFRDLGRRSKYLFRNPNLQLRVKFYDLKIENYMSYQMHNKFMVVDDSVVLTGSFNWSKSSENNHIENLVEISGRKAQEILPSFLQEFEMLWDLGRSEYPHLRSKLAFLNADSCSIPQMVLSVSEIKQLLKLAPQCN